MIDNSPDEEHIDPHGECAAEIHRLQSALSTAEQERDAALAAVGVLKEALTEAVEGLEWALDIQVMTDAFLKEQVPEAVAKLDWKTDAVAKQRATEAISASKSALANLPELAPSLIAEREAMKKVVDAAKALSDVHGLNARVMRDCGCEVCHAVRALRQSSGEAG